MIGRLAQKPNKCDWRVGDGAGIPKGTRNKNWGKMEE